MGREKLVSGGKLSFRMYLAGPFALTAPDGSRIAVSSKRGQALLALLATAPNGERTRRWLETILWCDRAAEQAKASLRKELSNLRKLLAISAPELVGADNNRVWLMTDQIWIDLIDGDPDPGEQFLEGLDLTGEENFEDWLRVQRSDLEGRDRPRLANPVLPDLPQAAAKPDGQLAIAVLPFRLEPEHAEREYAALGLAEDLINRLSRLRWLPVIARSSSFAIGTGPVDIRTAGKMLEASYIVEGVIRHGAEIVTLRISLSHAESGRVHWSENLELDSMDSPAALAPVLDGITAALDHKIDQSEQMRAAATYAGSSASAADIRNLIWKARWHLVRLTDDDMATAADLLAHAYAIDPSLPEILIEQAWLTVRRLWLHRGSEDEIRALRKMAQKAIFADPDDARGHMIAGIAEFWLGQPLRAEGLLRRAVELNPSLVMAHAQLGSSLHHKGDRLEAIAALETARRLSPNDFDLFFTEGELAMAHLAQGNLEHAIRHADASLSRRAAYWASHVAKINGLVGLGRVDEASRAYRDLKEAQPGFNASYIDWLPYLDPGRNKALKDGLNLAASAND